MGKVKTMIIKINPDNPPDRSINRITKILNNGGLIAYPTDTMYGIGCNLLNKRAIKKIYLLKQKKKNSPLSFICSNLKNISNYAKVTNYSYKTMKQFLPGPYTFILETSKLVPKIMLSKRKSAGIRIPNNKICIAIVKNLGNPIISTSAKNRENESLSDPSFIEDYFGKNLDAVVDGGLTPNAPSSVISLIGDYPEILRKGLGNVSMFEAEKR